MRSHDPAQSLTVNFFLMIPYGVLVLQFDTGHLSGTLISVLRVSLLLLKNIDIKQVTIAII